MLYFLTSVSSPHEISLKISSKYFIKTLYVKLIVETKTDNSLPTNQFALKEFHLPGDLMFQIKVETC